MFRTARKGASMRLPTESIVIDEANREAMRRVIDVTRERERPQRLLVVGPHGSGKTMALKARKLERDLLSPKKVMYCTCAELPKAMREGVSDVFLDDLGSVDVLLLDDLEGFFEDAEVGPVMCKLLLEEREKLGLDTVVTARALPDADELDLLGGVLDSFEQLSIAPLAPNGRVELVRMLCEDYSVDASPVLDDDAVEYVANDLDESLEAVESAVHYLMTQYHGKPQETISRNVVEKALA